MSVRIDNDFWTNYSEYETLIRKCFTYLYFKKYPVREGVESAYNFLVAELFRRSIFERFDAEREGKYTQTSIENKSERKKFEQFIYKWSESVMYNLYNKAKLDSERNLRFSPEMVDIMTPQSYASFKEHRGITPWDEPSEGLSKRELKAKEIRNNRVRDNIPTIADASDYRGEDLNSAYDDLHEKELWAKLEGALRNDRERLIVRKKFEGYNNTEISKIVGVTSSQVANIIKGIYGRCSKAFA